MAAKRDPSGKSSPRLYLPVSIPDASGKYGTMPSRMLAGRGHDRRPRRPRASRFHSICVATKRAKPRASATAAAVVDLLGRDVRRREVQHLPVAHQVVQRLERLVDGGRRRRGSAGSRGRCGRCRAGAGWSRTRSGSDAAARPARRPRRRGGARTWWRSPRRRARFPSAAPRNSSDFPPPYISAVSKCVIPASRAAWTTARDASSSIFIPKLLHPSPTTDTDGPSPPSTRVSIDS